MLLVVLLASVAAAMAGLEVESTVAHPEGCRTPVCQLHVTTTERGIVSCYVDASFSRGHLADFDAKKLFPATDPIACGTYVALDEMPLIVFHGDRWNATSIAGGWSELLNAKTHQARRFLVLQLAVTEGSRVEGTLVMTRSSQAADTEARHFCCGCEKEEL